ncbi:MAG TPA: invasion associated locus B family protein [Rhizomicrobium sp.]|jgi:invasion protein IalB|nr:invasion associated locus B family protein [Rhizomicrobium sp.]
MRNTLIGLAAAAVLIGVVALLGHFFPGQVPKQVAGPTPQQVETQDQINKQVASVTAGFIGTQDIGPWTLSCPQQAVDDPKDALPGADAVKFVRCRTQLLVRDSSNVQAVVLGAVVRPVEGSDDLTLILHTPPVSKPGANVIVVLAEKRIIGVRVNSCDKTQCIAIGVLKPVVYKEILAKPGVHVMVSVEKTGQRMYIPMTTKGLKQSLEAIKRAG